MNSLIENALKQFGNISVLQFILIVIVELAILTLILAVAAKYYDKTYSITDMLSFFCIIVYVNIILQFTLLGRKDGSRIGVELSLFKYLGSGTFSMQMLMYAVLNILLFVPYGFCLKWLPWFRKKRNGLSVVLITLLCLGTSMLIEVVQLATKRGYYELEDLFCNTLGGVIGCLMFLVLQRIMEAVVSRRSMD